MMNDIKKVGKYFVICFIGIALAFLVAFLQYDAKDFSASVLSIVEKDFFESTQRGAGYKKQNLVFEVFFSEKIRNEGELVISILYNPDEIQWLLDGLKSNCTIKNVEQDEGNLILTVDGYQNLDFDEGIFEIPYSGDSKEVVLEYVRGKEIFSIGNLDDVVNVETH